MKQISKNELFVFVNDASSVHFQNEICLLADHFERINLIYKKGNPPHGKNIQSTILKVEIGLQLGISDYVRLFGLFFSDLISRGLKFNYLRTARNRFSRLKNSFRLQIQLEKQGFKPSIAYSYWFDDWVMVLSLLRRNNPSLRIYTRAHGRDLYEEREPITQIIPFRPILVKEVDAVFPVSRSGANYLIKRYPELKGKTQPIYLGSSEELFIKHTGNKVPVILSVSKLRNIKRIFLIAEALVGIEIPFKWIHVGGLNTQARHKDKTIMRTIAGIQNLRRVHGKDRVSIQGNLSNEDVKQLYRLERPDLFVNVSSTEGIPISIMEAISFGTPILATDVGGVSEIVNAEFGRLLNKDLSVIELRENISTFLSNTDMRSARHNARNFWEKHFHHKKNIVKLAEKLMPNA